MMLYHYIRSPNVENDHDLNEFQRRMTQIIANSTIYLASPKDHNDPYDFAAHIPPPTEQQMTKFLREYIDKPTPEKNGAEITEALRETKRREYSDPENAHNWVKCLVRKTFDECGVFCLSGTKENLLMWSHYANKHGGICLAFDRDNCETLGRASKVTYVDKPVTINWFANIGTEIHNNHNREQEVWNACMSKWIEWECEKEYRYIDNKPGANRLKKIDDRALTEIYFGVKTDERVIKIIRELVRERRKPCTLFRARLAKTEYKMVFENYDE